LGCSRRCIHGAVADPLSARAAKNPNLMGILLVIMFVTLGLALRAATVSRLASLTGSERSDVNQLSVGFVDAYARTSFLVLLCLIGLFALGLVYGNVLGKGAA
jgi:hypothetical protein